jgi:hypothetical protein
MKKMYSIESNMKITEKLILCNNDFETVMTTVLQWAITNTWNKWEKKESLTKEEEDMDKKF